MSTSLTVILVLQWALILGLAAILLGVVRQIGVLHQRLAPAGALTMSHGVKAGERAPELRLRTLDGEALTLGGEDPQGRSTLIAFVAPDCPVCAALIPAIRAIASQEAGWLRVVFASDGDGPAHVPFRQRKGLMEFPYVVSMELGLTYQISKLPYAVLVDEKGTLVAQGLTNTREHLESLFEARRLHVASIQEYIDREFRGRTVEVNSG